MGRSSYVVYLISLLLCTSALADVSYKMRHNPQTGRGDWVIDETTLPAGVNWEDPDGLAMAQSATGWTHSTGQTVLTTITDNVGVGTTLPSTQFPLAKMIVSKQVTGHTYPHPIAIVGESVAVDGAGETATGLGGVASTNGAGTARGVVGVGKVTASADTGASVGLWGRAIDTHAGDANVAVFATAQNGATNYSFYGNHGVIYNADNVGIGTSEPLSKLYISGGLAQYEHGHPEFTEQHHIVDKEYVDEAVSRIGARLYMLDAADGEIAAYKSTSMTSSGLATASVSASVNAATDTLIEEWVSPVGMDWDGLTSGVYDLNVFAARTAGNRAVTVFWSFYERESDGDEVLIATSNQSEIVTTKSRLRIYAALTSDYTPAAGSRLVGKVYFRTVGGSQNTTCVLYYQGDEDSHWQIPVSQEFLDDNYARLDGANFTGNVGIGTSAPESKLQVAGTAQVTGFKLTTSPTAGYVLTSDSVGVGTWQPAAGGSSQWDDVTGGINYADGNVGIGTTVPSADLEVIGIIKGTSFVGSGVGLTDVSPTVMDTPISQNTSAATVTLGDSGGTEYRDAQGFVLYKTTTISAAWLYFTTRTGTPSGEVTITIETSVGGKPSGTLAHANATASITPTDGVRNTVVFSPFTISSGTYFLVARCSVQSTGNAWNLAYANTDVYPDSVQALSSDGGSTWTILATYDLRFGIISTTTLGGTLTVSSDGNVGINSSSPVSKLEIVGIGTTSATSSLIIRKSTGVANVTVLDNGNVGIGSATPTATLDVVGTVSMVKAPVAKTIGTVYQAESDGIVYGECYSTSNYQSLQFFTDATSTPTTVVRNSDNAVNLTATISYPVRKGYYYKVYSRVGTCTGGVMSFVPLGK